MVIREDVPPENHIVRGKYGEGVINLKPGSVPKNQRPIRLVGEKKEVMTKIAQGWIDTKKVEIGQSDWSSPAFPVPKKGTAKWRGVVDFRALNDATLTDAYPLPRIEDMLVEYGRKSLFSIFDLKGCVSPSPPPRGF